LCGWKWKWRWVILVAVTAVSGNASFSQGLTLQEWLSKQFLENYLVREQVAERVVFNCELDYTLSANCLLLVNDQHGNRANQAGMQQNLQVRYSVDRGKRFVFSTNLSHNLGFRYLFDSITELNQDDNLLTTRLDLAFARRWTLTFTSNITSRLFRSYDYRKDGTGQQVKVMNSSFLTPLVWLFSWGIGYSHPSFGKVNLGITGGKFTFIRETRIFEWREVDSYYGVEKGHNHLLEYGMMFQLLIDKDLVNSLHWKCDLSLFKNYNAPVDFSLKSLFGFKINKYLKTSLSTKILYEEKLSRQLQMENLLSIGFYIHL
jgi:hypothetical protein